MSAPLAEAAKKALTDAVRISLDLYKVMIPVIIGVKILKELDLIAYLAVPLGPLMELAGLPPDMGLVWATAILTNIYGGILVYVALPPGADPLSVAQVTVLSTMILIAHNIPVEGRITQKCGVGFWGQAVLRMAGALVCGMLMQRFFAAAGMLAEPARAIFTAAPAQASLPGWALGEAKNLVMIFGVILALIILMRILARFRVTDLFERLLAPVLGLLGIGAKAANITVIGLVMGLAYGGGLIMMEVKAGRLSRRDVFSSLSLMSLSHALIEDTLLMTLIGASMQGTFFGRLLFSMLVVAILSRLVGPRLTVPGSATGRPL